MRVVTTFAGVPNPWQAGGPLIHWALLRALVEGGHEVTFVSLPWETPPRADRLAPLRELGVGVLVLDHAEAQSEQRSRWRARLAYLRSTVWPSRQALFPDLASAPALVRAVHELEPDVVVALGTNAVAAASEIGARKLALVADPPGLSRRLRVRWDPQYPWRLGRDEVLYRLGSATFVGRADRRFVRMLRSFDSVGVFGAHRAEWARRRGVKAWYAWAPIVDAAGHRWRERRAAVPPNPRPRILMIGHLRGISTISGLHVFARSVLPELTRVLGAEAFEVHIVGEHNPPDSLRRALDHPAVRLRGHVEPPDDEFLTADVLLVPTPVETGPRVRILTGFSFGCCVVAHTANRLGIPELEHDVNVLLADGHGLATAVLRALDDQDLRTRLGESGRALYESRFTPERAGGRIVAELEQIATGRR